MLKADESAVIAMQSAPTAQKLACHDVQAWRLTSVPSRLAEIPGNQKYITPSGPVSTRICYSGRCAAAVVSTSFVLYTRIRYRRLRCNPRYQFLKELETVWNGKFCSMENYPDITVGLTNVPLPPHMATDPISNLRAKNST